MRKLHAQLDPGKPGEFDRLIALVAAHMDLLELAHRRGRLRGDFAAATAQGLRALAEQLDRRATA